MRTLAGRAVATLVVALFVIALDPLPAGAASRPKVVYVVSEARGFVHASIADARAYFELLDRLSRRLVVFDLPAARSLTLARLRIADAVVFANTSGELEMSRRQLAALGLFARLGGGIVGTHSATDTFHSLPGWEALLGAEFDSHPPPAVGRVVVEDARHPATRRLPRTFEIEEEFYEFTSDPRARAHVLASLQPQSIGQSAGERWPLVWCRSHGRGRVFYNALGHFSATWSDDARFRVMTAGGLLWAAGLARGECAGQVR